MDIYQQVEEKALPLIKAYHNDLIVHDKKAITENPGIPFLHFTGDTGTCLMLLIPAKDYPAKGEKVPYLFGIADRLHILKEKTEIVRCMRTINRRDLVLCFDGEKLGVITQEWAESIVQKYQEKISLEWRKQEKSL